MKPNPDHRQKLGAGGSCFCPKCEHTIDHSEGVPCQTESCPQCGSKMLRVGSSHYQMFMRKRASVNR